MNKSGLLDPGCSCDLCHAPATQSISYRSRRISHDLVICDAAWCGEWAQNALRRLNELTPYRDVKMPEVVTVLGLDTGVTPAAA